MQQLNANFFWDEIRQVSALGNDQQDLDITKLKPLIDSASYLIRQVEICDNELSKINALPLLFRERMKDEVRDWDRQKTQYLRSLNQVINQL
jgi:hypothetical protein